MLKKRLGSGGKKRGLIGSPETEVFLGTKCNKTKNIYNKHKHFTKLYTPIQSCSTNSLASLCLL